MGRWFRSGVRVTEPGASDELLLTAEVAAITRVPEGTLRDWRSRKNNPGPKSFKVGPKVVVYRRSEVENWISAQEAGAGAD